MPNNDVNTTMLHRPLVIALIFTIIILSSFFTLFISNHSNEANGYNPPEICIYIVQNNSSKLLNKEHCDENRSITVYNISNNDLVFGLKKMLALHKAILILPLNDYALKSIINILSPMEIHLNRKPSSLLIYDCNGNACILFLFSTDNEYILKYMAFGVKASSLISYPSILIPSSIDDVPILYSISLLELEENNSSSSNISMPDVVNYNKMINIIIIGLLDGCLSYDSELNISVKVLSGGIIAGYQPSTSYSPITFILSIYPQLRLGSNFTGVYKDRSDFSLEIIKWAIEVNKCQDNAIQVIPTYASIGKIEDTVKLLINFSTNEDQINITIKK
ncbi:MAG: hypothetical protein GSR85_00190 [Desulfurococcales archaeon]|nr:hypothetical protein [Desulfurococcales archaeon]